eukprot:SM004159S15254  [mRNA]  locus=s4159:110:1275:+ [translate_table: standard]
MSASRAVVLINPEHLTAWNLSTSDARASELLEGCRRAAARKKVLAGRDARGCLHPDAIAAELGLAALTLGLHAKSGATWAHRRWVLARLVLQKRKEVDSRRLRGLLEAESQLVLVCAEVQEELSSNRQWVRRHLDDNSAFHYQRVGSLSTARIELRQGYSRNSLQEG